MKKPIRYFIVGAFLLLLNLFTYAQSQNEFCTIVAKVALPTATTATYAACFATGHPTVCNVGIFLHQMANDEMVSNGVETIVEEGCVVVYEKTSEFVKATIKYSKDKLFEAEQTYNALNSAAGVHFLQLYFSP